MIRGASLRDGRTIDLRVSAGRIVAIGPGLPADGARVIEAHGGLLLPGLHDHHVHIAAAAAAMASVRCGPPEVEDEGALAAVLSVPGEDWLRGIGYHDSVAGAIDRHWLDAAAPRRPVRVQHRSGRMWILNSAGLDRVFADGVAPPPGLERSGGAWTGRLFDEDDWLRSALGSTPPAFDAVGALLARYGVTGVTEMSPANDGAVARHFAAERRRGALPQRVRMAGRLELGDGPIDEAIELGPLKLHLHEANLPDFAAMVASIRAAHAQGRGVAVHCVTVVELTFTLAALREAAARAGDRIEHASVASDELVAQLALLDLAVVAQPHFVAERGDAYLAEIPQADWPQLYRLRAFRNAGVVLAGGSDMPFGDPDPWAAMAAAVSRRTQRGVPLGESEALTPDEALDLFLADPVDLSRTRELAVGAAADLCLLASPWREARMTLSANLVRATFLDGRLIHDRIDQSPAPRGFRTDPLAG